ncbi:MAG: universal stress protein [Desulfobacterales bacterium]|jgi:nucleotide-binding universal stress UspA family protein
MAGQKLLLPFNFTDQDRKALDFVIQTFAHAKDIEISVFHAYTPIPEIEASDTSVTGRLKDQLGYLTTKLSEQETALQEVKKALIQNGFPESNISCTFKARKKDIAAEILDLISNEGYEIVILSHKAGRVKRFFTGSVYHKVLAVLKGVTVCIVS